MPGPPLDERFINPTLDARSSWRCEPAHWRMEAGRLRMEPDADLREIWLRLERTGADYLVESSTDGVSWSQLRLAHLHADDGRGPVAAGLYACSPKAAGYVAEFAYLRLTWLHSPPSWVPQAWQHVTYEQLQRGVGPQREWLRAECADQVTHAPA